MMIGQAYLWPGRFHERLHISTRQYARLVHGWVTSSGLELSAYGPHSMRRTKVAQIYRKTGNPARRPAPARPHQDGQHGPLPDIPNEVIRNLCDQLMALHKRVRWDEERVKQGAKDDAKIRLLRTIPGIGLLTASAIIASIGDGHQFKSGREFAAWLGLTPANRSSSGKEKPGRITKMGDQSLRQLLAVGMTSLVRQTRLHPERASKWLTSLLERKPARVAPVAMANKTARIVWAVLTRNEAYCPRAAEDERSHQIAEPAR